MYLKKFTSQELIDFKLGQKKMTDMLREVDRICRKYNLQYWCTGGTLIGVLRHKGWIPWDADIDVGILDTDYEILQEKLKTELPDCMWFQDITTDKYYTSKIGKIRNLNSNYKNYKCRNWHNGLQLDFFIFKKDNNILKPIKKINDVQNTDYDIIFPLKELMFEDITVYIPNEYEKYSIHSWGNYPPEMPPENKQYPHEGKISLEAPEWMKNKYPELYKKLIQL